MWSLLCFVIVKLELELVSFRVLNLMGPYLPSVCQHNRPIGWRTWRSGLVINGVAQITVVAVRQAGLVLKWVTVRRYWFTVLGQLSLAIPP